MRRQNLEIVGKSDGGSPNSGAGGGWIDMLRGHDKEAILEVLSQGVCEHCQADLQARVLDLCNKKCYNMSILDNAAESSPVLSVADPSQLQESKKSSGKSWDNAAKSSPVLSVADPSNLDPSQLQESKKSSGKSQDNAVESSPVLSVADPSKLDSSQLQESKKSSEKSRLRRSLLTPESIHVMRRKGILISFPGSSVNRKQSSSTRIDSGISLISTLSQVSPSVDKGLSEEHEECAGFAQVGRKKDFVHIEKINRKSTNILQGLELHTNVFSADEQKKIVECVYDLQRKGQNGQLKERTYTEPTKWMRGKGRVTIQFGCCYNYAVDKKGNRPGIIREEEVDSLPPLFKKMITKMVRWHVFPPLCVPNSCIVNIYDVGDCIPPHIDHHDFVRPFCTVSFLTECNILFGTDLKVIGPGEFEGPVSIPLPVGSVLILNGNGADIAKHCVPGVPAKRISITFRKMDDSKLPYKFAPDPELQGPSLLVYTPSNDSSVQNKQETETVGPSQVSRNASRSFKKRLRKKKT